MRHRFYRHLLLSLCTAATLMACDNQEERAQSYLERGIALYDEGNLVKARLELRNALQIDPKQAEAWLLLAKIAEQQEEWPAAYSAYGKTVELAPENWEARVKLGSLQLASNQIDAALTEAEKVLAANPEDPSALALRGFIGARRGDLEAALRDAETALDKDPQHREALALLAQIRLQQEDLPAAKDTLETALAAHPEDLRLMLAMAGVSQQLGDSEATEAILRRLVEREPDTLDHRTRLAQYLNARGDAAGAEQVLRDAVAAMPGRSEPKLLLVELFAATRGPDAAIAELAALAANEPDAYDLQFALATMHTQTGNLEEAEAVYRKVIARDDAGPEGRRAQAKLAALLLSQERAEDARQLAAEVLSEDPENNDALLVRAALALQDGNPDQAIADLRIVTRNNPASVGALSLLAQAHLARDEIALADDALSQAIELAPDQPAGYLQLATLRARAGDPDGAALILEDLLARDPDSALAQTALAQIQQSQPDTEALEETAEQIIRSRPEHPLGYYLKGQVLQRRGALEASIEQFELALAKEAKAAQPLVALARSYLALEQPEKAEARLQQVLADSPSNAVAINLLGEVYIAAGRLDEAKAQYETAIAQRPGAPLPYERLARLALAEGDAERAIETLETGIEATERSPLLVAALPLVLEEAGQYAQAIAAYEAILAENPGADWAANNLAMLLANQRADDPDSLSRALTLVQRFEGAQQAPFLDTLGWVQYRNGNFEAAVKALERMQAAGEMTPERQYHLGMTYLALGRLDDARPLLTAAASAEQPFPGIEEARAALP